MPTEQERAEQIVVETDEIIERVILGHKYLTYDKVKSTIVKAIADALSTARQEERKHHHQPILSGKEIVCLGCRQLQRIVTLREQERGAEQRDTLRQALDAANHLIAEGADEAEKIVKAETERCAKVAEDDANKDWIGGSTGNAGGTAKMIAAAIREGADATQNA